MKNISPIHLCLLDVLDGSEEHWNTQKVEIPIVIPTGEHFFIKLIDWTWSIISFWTSELSMMPAPKGSSLLVSTKAATSTIIHLTWVLPDTPQSTQQFTLSHLSE